VLVNTASNRSIDEYKAQTLTSTRATKIDTRVEHLLKHLVIVHCHYFIITILRIAMNSPACRV
jgi:hypothetical protein